MALYDDYYDYASFRDEKLTPDEEQALADARANCEKMEADPTLERRDGGFWNEKEGFTPHPVVGAHTIIAMDRAKKQFENKPIMPESAVMGLRFPGVDPMGKYSIIDMKFAQREAIIMSTLESRSPKVQEYVKGLMNKCKSPSGGAFFTKRELMLFTAQNHRLYTRGSKLCLDADGRKLLHAQARNAETDLGVTQYDQLMQGIEYAAGVRRGPVPKEITDFYKNMLHSELDLGIVAAAADIEQSPAQIHVDFEDLDHKLLQLAFADPVNWNKTSQEITGVADKYQTYEVTTMIDPYAIATADRAIDPLFRNMERDAPDSFRTKVAEKNGLYLDTQFSRGDLISIDGRTVREIMQDDYKLTNENADPKQFEEFYRQNVKQMTNRYVAAGLMAGKRVEAFVPNKYGEIPKEPTQITKTGYEPSPLKPERFNAWQRFFSKHGFYKNKVEREKEYNRVMEARERMREKAALSGQAMRQERTQLLRNVAESSAALRARNNTELFFGQLMGEMGLSSAATTPEGKTEVTYDWDKMNAQMSQFHVTNNQTDHVEPVEICIMGLLAQGIQYSDIMQSNGLQDMRQTMARMVMEHSQKNDQEWLGRICFRGSQAALQQLQKMTQDVDLTNEAQLLQVLPQVENLAHTAFNASQAISNSECRLGFYKAAMEAAAGDMDKGSLLADQTFWKIQDVALATQGVLLGAKGQLKLIDPQADVHSKVISDVNSALRNCAVGAATMSAMTPGTSILDSVPANEVMLAIHRQTTVDQQLKAVGPTLAKAPQAQRAAVVRSAANGKLTGELFHASVTLTPDSIKDEVDYLTKADDGTLSLQTKKIDRPFRQAKVSVNLDKELTGPAREAQQQAPQKKHHQKQGPQRGGHSR